MTPSPQVTFLSLPINHFLLSSPAPAHFPLFASFIQLNASGGEQKSGPIAICCKFIFSSFSSAIWLNNKSTSPSTPTLRIFSASFLLHLILDRGLPKCTSPPAVFYLFGNKTEYIHLSWSPSFFAPWSFSGCYIFFPHLWPVQCWCQQMLRPLQL